MSVRLGVEQVRTVEEGPTYRVVTTVYYNLGVDRNIFVFNAETDDFEHVATPWDLDNTPTSKQTALDTGVDYYRLSEVTKDNDTVDDASTFASYTLERISALARAYESVATEFAGTDTYSYLGS